MVTNTKPKFVIDNSVIMAVLLKEPISSSHIIDTLNLYFSHQVILYAPHILPFEAGNVLRSCLLSRRITPEEANKLYRYFLKLPIKYVTLPYPTIFKICLATNLTYYDATYLTLSEKLHLPLLTLDKKLAALAK